MLPEDLSLAAVLDHSHSRRQHGRFECAAGTARVRGTSAGFGDDGARMCMYCMCLCPVNIGQKGGCELAGQQRSRMAQR
jgi:hypothetical protein